ncbi:MAG TPA: TMEM165/GDT1 family protein [Rhodospirillaceae bacterium]|nr:TMEM165/GDT1 family protein [Rhodospirillales bacterium]HIJ43001.1 TMEM165/GDT1 family protein [Rhodospirillaceae bacterium]HIJ44949.1 TMEM165/GDT1 family protein [Rhodospirillaceae bacterium]HIJ93395.1 TMEM165/GDT1 family protein [Rhodospirillaceae bacterium]HJP54761.1 TMEM165/GDT1 family protein [Rhodospirillales bacterium]
MLKLAAVFVAVFVAELGDKTQLATLLFASDKDLPAIHVFIAAASALVLSTALAVVAGNLGGRYLDMVPLKAISGAGFIAIGLWILVEHFRAS